MAKANPAGGAPSSSLVAKVLIVAVLVGAAVAVLYAKKQNQSSLSQSQPLGEGVKQQDGQGTSTRPADASPKALPRLLDLGADKCIPCKMMAPILEEMKKEYQGRLDVEFIDVWKNPNAGQKYGIESIPTQIFYDSDGNELFRHVGFFSKEEILAKWTEFGVDLGTAGSDEKGE